MTVTVVSLARGYRSAMSSRVESNAKSTPGNTILSTKLRLKIKTVNIDNVSCDGHAVEFSSNPKHVV